MEQGYSLGNKKVFLAVFIIAVVVLAGGLYFVYQQKPVNYVISGVPYYGFYNEFYNAFASQATAAAMLFGYYGDTRLTLRDFMDKQYYQTNQGFFNSRMYTVGDFTSFLRGEGYEVSTGGTAADAISFVKQFVNPSKKTPLIVALKSSINPSASAIDYGMIIGLRENEKKLILHDFLYGNNYEISYDDFLKRFVPETLLAARPAASLAPQLKGIDASRPVPERITAMDRISGLIAERAEADLLAAEGKSGFAEGAFKSIIANPRFAELHPLAKMIIYQELSALYLSEKRNRETITLITENVLPLNHDLDKDYNGWKIGFLSAYPSLTKDESAWPYVQLGDAYAAEGDLAQAHKELNEAFSLHPGYMQEAPPIILPAFQ